MAKRSKTPRRPTKLSRILERANKPRSSSKLLASVSHDALRRASPTENIRMGYSPKARRYVKADVHKIGKTTASISARQAETKRTRERYGYETLEAARRARRSGALKYESRSQGERVEKAEQTRLIKQVGKAGTERKKIPYDPAKRRQDQKQRTVTLKPGDGERYQDLRKRRLSGEWLDIADFVWLMDVGEYFNDPQSAILRQSPDARSAGFAVDDDLEDAA